MKIFGGHLRGDHARWPDGLLPSKSRTFVAYVTSTISNPTLLIKEIESSSSFRELYEELLRFVQNDVSFYSDRTARFVICTVHDFLSCSLASGTRSTH